MQAFIDKHPFLVFVGADFHARFSNFKCAVRTAFHQRGSVMGPESADYDQCRILAAQWDFEQNKYRTY